MAPTLGKRKRVTREQLAQPSRSPSISDSEDSDREDLQEVFRRAFEAKFKPIQIEPVIKIPEQDEVVAEDEDEESDSEWSGLSSDEDNGVEIVECAGAQRGSDKASKAEMRAFMVRSCSFTTRSLSKHGSPQNHPRYQMHLCAKVLPTCQNQRTTPSKLPT